MWGSPRAAITTLAGAHCLPFVTLYGMRMFAAVGGVLVGGGVVIATHLSRSFSVGAWFTGATLLVFAAVGRVIAQHEWRGGAQLSPRTGRTT